ncbi:MAG: Ppx/GppA family phosphatase [Deltaproteobacteria bacterium]|nr:Ppx/GppA family phosphatase [Deltaproteobacteria bacterium]
MSLLAAIDVGTNTVRLLVAKRDGRGLRPVERGRRITGMGKAMRATGEIGPKEFRESVNALKEFRGRMDALGVERYRACGTAALRDASNRPEFLEAAKAAGVSIEVISAEEEASRTWKGIHWRIRGVPGIVVMDIGGGSTEFIAGPGKGESVSLPIGVVVSCDLLPVSDPPEPWQVRNLRYYYAERISSGTGALGRRYRKMVGTAGTFTTLAALDRKMTVYQPEKIDGCALPLERVKYWVDRLSKLTEAGRLRLRGMEKGRERYILPGICQAVAAMEHFKVDELIVSDAGLLEGILLGLPIGKGEKG